MRRARHVYHAHLPWRRVATQRSQRMPPPAATGLQVVEDGPFVNQEGIFAQAAPGRPLEKIRGERRERVRAIPRDQILEVRLYRNEGGTAG